MKSKKIVALALAAAMALSISMTAFAAKENAKTFFKVTDYQVKDGDTTTKYSEAYVLYYSIEDGDVKPYVIATPDKVKKSSETTADGKTTITLTVDDDTNFTTTVGSQTITFTPNKLGASYSGNDVLLGWVAAATEPSGIKGLTATAKVENGALTGATVDGFIAPDGAIDFESAPSQATPLKLWAVTRAKSDDEKAADAIAEANADKVAESTDGKTKYSKAKIAEKAKVEDTDETTASAALKAANAAKDKSVVKEIYPTLADEKTKVNLINGATVKVEISHNFGDKAVKVFHITKDGKAVEVTDTKQEKNKVSFEYGDFSQFVVTTDENAKGEPASTATSTEPEATATEAAEATSTEAEDATSTSTGTEDTAADGGAVPTGEFSALPIALLAVAALSATGVVAYKKRIAE